MEESKKGQNNLADEVLTAISDIKYIVVNNQKYELAAMTRDFERRVLDHFKLPSDYKAGDLLHPNIFCEIAIKDDENELWIISNILWPKNKLNELEFKRPFKVLREFDMGDKVHEDA